VTGERLLELVAVMDRLRSPGGCPWDAAQTHASLLPYLLEEAYETVEAVETADLEGLKEELGDLLLQVVFHARLGEEHAEQPWSIDDVAAGIVTKLVSRHPHVFADGDAVTADDVERTWEELKRAEKGRTSAVDGVPLAQPALALAHKLVGRAEKAGVALPLPALVLPGDGPLDEASTGALLLALVARARADGVDAEAALRAASRRYADDVRAAEAGGPGLVASGG
jgi:XTP/dITP diphosphohydrolase